MKNLFRHFFGCLLILTSITNVLAQHISVTVAGCGKPGYYGDGGLARMGKVNKNVFICVDQNQNIYFSDQSSRVIRKVSGRDGVITTIAGGGTSTSDGIPATSAFLNITGLCVDRGGNIYVVSGNTKLKRIDAVSQLITTYAGGGSSLADGIPATAASIVAASVCADASGNIYLTTNNRVRKIDASTHNIVTIGGSGSTAYSGDGGPATLAGINSPLYIAADDTGNIYFSDLYAYGITRIRKINHFTGFISTVIGSTSTSGPIEYCLGLDLGVGPLSGLACDRKGCVVISELSCSCRKWDPATDTVYPLAGNFTIESFDDDTTSIYAYMNTNHGVCVDNENNYYVADTANRRVRKIIPLSIEPKFAFGHGQYITPCPDGGGHRLDSLLWITDIDLTQPETWTVAVTPVHGSLSGFPFTTPSNGKFRTTKPRDLFYTPCASYVGSDSFSVAVSDGVYIDTIIIYVSVQPPPTITIITPDSICNGVLRPVSTNVVGGSWGSIHGYVSVNANDSASATLSSVLGGFDTLTYTLELGCSVTAKNAVRINPSLAAAIIVGPDTICAGSAVAFSSPMTGGTWTTTNYAVSIVDLTTGICTGVLPGVNYIQYNVSNECGSATNSKPLVVKDCGTTATTLISNRSKPLIYPNPASQTLFINSGTTVSSPLTVKITNTVGQVIMQTELPMSLQAHQVDVSKIPPGTYFATLISETTYWTSKFTIER